MVRETERYSEDMLVSMLRGTSFPSAFFDQPQQGIVMDARLSQKPLVFEILVEQLYAPVWICLTFDFDGFDSLIVQTFGATAVGSGFRL